jgi:drug/metabolite transporter (DMT)-like permease
MTALQNGRDQAKGALIVLGVGVIWSSGGLILRSMESATSWQVMFYRSIGMALGLLLAIAIRNRGKLVQPFRRMGWGGLLVGGVLTCSTICYVLAINGTTVANAMFVMSTGPFFTALLAWIFLGEKVRPLTWAAIGVAILGMGLMSGAGRAGEDWHGMLFAAGNAVAFASIVVLTRYYRDVDIVPAFVVGAVLLGIITAATTDLGVSLHDALLGIGFGAFHSAAGLALLAIGARYVTAAAAGLLMLSEPILSPIWVWLAIDETPTLMALVGGLFVLAAVSGQALHSFYDERRATG